MARHEIPGPGPSLRPQRDGVALAVVDDAELVGPDVVGADAGRIFERLGLSPRSVGAPTPRVDRHVVGVAVVLAPDHRHRSVRVDRGVARIRATRAVIETLWRAPSGARRVSRHEELRAAART